MDPEKSKPFSRRHPFLANAGLLCAAIVVGVIIIDLVAFHALGLRRLAYGADRFFQHSSSLGWEHVPHARGTWYAYKDGTRTSIAINSYGFPDAERELDKTMPRIALIGDSTAEFWEVDEGDRPQFLMQSMLGQRVEVLNFGLRGAGTDQELIRFTQQVVPFSPDIVVLLFCVSDVFNNASTDSKPYFVLDPDAPDGIRLAGIPVRGYQREPERWPRSWLQHSFTLRQLKYGLFGVLTHLRVDEPLDSHLELRALKREYDAEDHRRAELLHRLLASFARQAREHDIRLLLVEGVYRPSLDEAMRRQVVDAYGDVFDFERVSRLLAEISDREGIEFLSLQRLVKERGIDVRDLFHPEDTVHLNAEGARLLSIEVIARIRQLDWLPGTASGAGAPPL